MEGIINQSFIVFTYDQGLKSVNLQGLNVLILEEKENDYEVIIEEGEFKGRNLVLPKKCLDIYNSTVKIKTITKFKTYNKIYKQQMINSINKVGNVYNPSEGK